MFLGELYNNSAETQKGYKVGQRHETVESIANIPNKAELKGGTDNDYQNEDDLINLNALALEEILEAAGSVQRPAENSAQREKADSNRNYKRAYFASEQNG